MINTHASGLSPAANQQLVQAGQELSVLALAQPGRYLKSLSFIRAFTSNEIKPDKVQDALVAIRQSFWTALPPQPATPARQTAVPHSLNEKFVTNLEKLKHE
jgi:hypothetical protein